MLSGYRVLSRRFVKSFPFTAEGFGIETELTVHAVRLMMPMAEMDTRYKERPVGRSASSTPIATASASCSPSAIWCARNGR